MLSIRENFLETLRGGKPDRFVNQYEYMQLVSNPISRGRAGMCPKGGVLVNDWGVTSSWPEHVITPFPVHTPEKIVIKDVTRWREMLHAPDPGSYGDMWEEFEAAMAAVDRKEKFAASISGPGLFGRMHTLMGMTGCLASFYEEPEATHELLDFFLEWELKTASLIVERQRPEALFQHDDWGTQTRLFFSPAIFEEFFLERYRKLYGFWKDNGVEVIVHHSDSYAASLVPYMIELGVDVYQGAVSENDIPKLIRAYGGQITIHGGLDNGKHDKEDWSVEALRRDLRDLVEKAGPKFLIPGMTMGGPSSIIPGVYEALSREIDALSKEYF